MKFLGFSIFDVAKAAEVAQAADKTAKTPGCKILAQYACQGIPFEGVPPNKIVVVSVEEYESNDAIAANQYPLSLAGANVWAVPVLEMKVGGAARVEKKYRK
jgi:hypothetical protein